MAGFFIKLCAIVAAILISISVGLSVGLNNSIKGNPNSTDADMNNLYYSISFSLVSILLSSLVFGSLLTSGDDSKVGVLKMVVLLVPTILVGITLGIAFGYQTFYLNDNRFKAAIILLGIILLITLLYALRSSTTSTSPESNATAGVILFVSILMVISGALLWSVEDTELNMPDSVKNGYKSLYFITVFGGAACVIASLVFMYFKHKNAAPPLESRSGSNPFDNQSSRGSEPW